MFTDLRIVSLLVLAFRIPPHTGKARQTWKRCRGFTAFPSPTPSCWKSGRSSKRKPRTEIIGKLEGCVTVSGLSFPPVHLSCAWLSTRFCFEEGLRFQVPWSGSPSCPQCPSETFRVHYCDWGQGWGPTASCKQRFRAGRSRLGAHSHGFLVTLWSLSLRDQSSCFSRDMPGHQWSLCCLFLTAQLPLTLLL